MPQNRFYLNGTLERGAQVFLGKEEEHHMLRVMRVRTSEFVEIVNGKGFLATGKLLESGAIHLESVLEDKQSASLTLVQAFLKPSKLELIVEKGTELGISSFHFYPAEKSLRRALSERDLKRLRALTISAMKQCGRLDLPSIAVHSALPPLSGTIFFGDIEGKKHPIQGDITFICGPESGFTQREKEALAAMATPLCLGKSILRAETAPLALAAIKHFNDPL